MVRPDQVALDRELADHDLFEVDAKNRLADVSQVEGEKDVGSAFELALGKCRHLSRVAKSSSSLFMAAIEARCVAPIYSGGPWALTLLVSLSVCQRLAVVVVARRSIGSSLGSPDRRDGL